MLCMALLLLAPHRAFAHAVLVSATPANHATVHTGDTQILLKYNSRIDAARSSLTLVGPDGTSHTLALDTRQPPNVLAANAKGLVAGVYRVQWQVLSSDGHISRGVVTFHVA